MGFPRRSSVLARANLVTLLLLSVLICQFTSSVIARPQELEIGQSGTISDGPGGNNGSIGTNWDGPIRRCPTTDTTALNQCLRLILGDLKPRLANGVPELNLPSMDPLVLKNVAFRHGSGPIKIVATFNNVQAMGLSQYDQSDFRVDMARKSLTFDMGIPAMKIIGNYDLSGNLFVFPIGGTGNFWLHLVGIQPKGRGDLEIVERSPGVKTLQLRTIDLDLSIQGLKVHLTNLFNGDKFLGNVMNNFINENSLEIFSELRPQIARRVGEMVKVLTNKALGALSSDYFTDLSLAANISSSS